MSPGEPNECLFGRLALQFVILGYNRVYLDNQQQSDEQTCYD